MNGTIRVLSSYGNREIISRQFIGREMYMTLFAEYMELWTNHIIEVTIESKASHDKSRIITIKPK